MNGLLVIDKPAGITSAKTVEIIKKTLMVKKCGHTGTLDPFATGLLIVCVNRATRIAQYILNCDKSYIASLVFGITTDTYDVKGKITNIKKKQQKTVCSKEIKGILPKYTGEIEQHPPMYSALKFKGKRLYTLARKGIKIQPPSRKIIIHSIDMVDFKSGIFPELTLEVKCSKGTYIRSLCHDIGQDIGMGAFVSRLRRTSIGSFDLSHSVTLEDFIKLPFNKKIQTFIPIDQILDIFPKNNLKNDQNTSKRIKHGQPFTLNEIQEIVSISNQEGKSMIR